MSDCSWRSPNRSWWCRRARCAACAPRGAGPGPIAGERRDMELDQVAWWVAVVSSMIVLVRLGRARFAGGWGWAAVCALVLVVATFGSFAVPDQAGLIAGAVWLILLVAPLRLVQLSGLRVIQQRFAAARLYAGLA